jgi:hypothetical protein
MTAARTRPGGHLDAVASGIPQGDRTILTRLLILSHSAFSAASTKTPHERRRAQVRAPEPVWVSMPPRWSSLPDSPARGTSPRVELQPCLIGHRAAGFGPGQQYDEVGAITLDAEASGGVSVRDIRYPSDTQGWQCIWVDTYCQNAREGGSAMWLKKYRERSAEETLDAVQPVESLRRAAEEGGCMSHNSG